MKKIVGCLIISVSLLHAPVQAASGTGLKLPRYVSLKTGEANVRTGPGINHPIVWVFKRLSLPVEIVAESKQWRKIRDIDGDEGWVHGAMLSSKRMVMVTDDLLTMYNGASESSRPLARLERGVEARLLSCDQDFCQLMVEGHKGWAKRAKLWGIYPSEIFN